MAGTQTDINEVTPNTSVQSVESNGITISIDAFEVGPNQAIIEISVSDTAGFHRLTASTEIDIAFIEPSQNYGYEIEKVVYDDTLLTSCRCQEITDHSVIYQDKEGTVHEIPADTVVIATGDRPDPSLYEALEGKVPELYNIGDSNGAGVIAKAVNQGYYCGLKL